MKRSNTFHFLTLTLLITCLISFGCESDDSSTTPAESDLVGTWVLTEVIETFNGETETMTPEEANMNITIILNSDNCCTGTVQDDDGAWNLTGTWSATENMLSINWQGDDAEPVPYTLSGNTLTITTSYEDPDFGVTVQQQLVFTKR